MTIYRINAANAAGLKKSGLRIKTIFCYSVRAFSAPDHVVIT